MVLLMYSFVQIKLMKSRHTNEFEATNQFISEIDHLCFHMYYLIAFVN